MVAPSGYWHWYGRVTTAIYAVLTAVAAGLAGAAIVIRILGI